MTDNLTDAEIVKALEEWRKEIIADYQRLQLLDAPMDCFEESHADTVTKLSNALDLINRQEAEIERLEKMVQELIATNENLEIACAENKVRTVTQNFIKAEAYKEVWQKLKKEMLVCGQVDVDEFFESLVGE